MSNQSEQPEQDQEFTLEQASALTNRSVESLRQLARRGKIRKGRPTNSGKTTVILNPTEISSLFKGQNQPPGQPGDVQPEQKSVEHPDQPVQPGDVQLLISALTGQIDAMTNHLNTLKTELSKRESELVDAKMESTEWKIEAQQNALKLAILTERLRQLETEKQRSWMKRMFR